MSSRSSLRDQRLRLVWTLTPIVIAVVLGSAALTRAAPATPLDTPAPIVTDDFNEWALGGGFLYWAKVGGVVVESVGHQTEVTAYLRRKPAHGGPSTLLSEVDTDPANQFNTLAADESGVYYYDADEGAILGRPVDDPQDPARVVVTGTVPSSDLVLDDDYIYWINSDKSQILRVRKPTHHMESFPAVKDAYVDKAHPRQNFGRRALLKVGGTQASPVQALVQFNLSSIPHGARVQQATFVAYLEEWQGPVVPERRFDIALSRVSQWWQEGAVNWDTRPRLAPMLPTATNVARDEGWYVWDATSLARGWIEDVFVNHGFSMVARDLDDQFRARLFQSSEGPGPPNRWPMLVVDYCVSYDVETVADDLDGAADLISVGGHVYWLDENGLWHTDTSCGSTPCSKALLVSDARGDHLAFNNEHQSRYSVYWVDDGGHASGESAQRIRRYEGGVTIGPRVSTVYTADSPDWIMGQIAVGDDDFSSVFHPAHSHLFWTQRWSPYAPGTGDGHVRRMPVAGGPAEILAAGFAYIDQDLYTDDRYLYFANLAGGGDHTVYQLPFDASAIQRDLQADAMEVTQAIQDVDNQVSLIADKRTFVRVFGHVDQGPLMAEAVLHGTRGDASLPGSPLSPVNGTRALGSVGGYDRGLTNDGWLFRLPQSWTEAGTISLVATLDPRGLYADPEIANNEVSGRFSFTERLPLCIYYCPVSTEGPSYSQSSLVSESPNALQMHSLATNLWPTWRFHGTTGPFVSKSPSYDLPSDGEDLLYDLLGVYYSSTPPFPPCRLHVVGMVHPDVNTCYDQFGENRVGGQAFLGSHNVSWVLFPPDNQFGSHYFDWPEAGTVLAHELGHNLGRQHVDCPVGQPENTDPHYPYPTDQIGTIGTHYGFAVRTHATIGAAGAKDFMSYCSREWTSDYTWEAILDLLEDPGYGGRQSFQNLSISTSAVLARGMITPSLHAGSLGHAWVYPTAEMGEGLLSTWQGAGAVDAATTDYHLRLLDEEGFTLVDEPIAPAVVADSAAECPVAPFAVAFEAPSGAVARLELLKNTTLLDSRDVGPATPRVTVLEPTGGETLDEEIDLVWQVSDVDDGNQLLHNVQYSPDNGQRWFPLLVDFLGPQGADVFTVPLTILNVPGSEPNEAVIRVASSDGYHTGLATSTPFTVLKRQPEPYITAPLEGEAVPAGESVMLQGGGMDPEDGALSADSLAWAVDGQAKGTGEDVTVSGLASGDHDVLLTAHDADGLQATVQRTFTIPPLGVPQDGSPSLDGFCDDAAYAEGVQVQLEAYGDDSQATVHLVRSDAYLWACFSGMAPGGLDPVSFAGIRVDPNLSADSLAQPDDYSLYVGEDGGYSTYAGDGAGEFSRPGPGGLQAQVSAAGSTWSAELRVDADVIGGWGQIVGMSLGHYAVDFEGDDYEWPYETEKNQPDTWSATALGDLPHVTGLDPASAIVGDPDFTLMVGGRDFVDGASVLWDEIPLPTTFHSNSLLHATVTSGYLGTAGTVEVTVRNPGEGNLTSNPVQFGVQNPAPAVSNLNPPSVEAGSDGFTLSINGSDFVPGASIFWSGTARATTFVSSSQLTTQIGAGEVAEATVVGVVVNNPDPSVRVSNTALFTVRSVGGQRLFLPLILRE